MKTSIKFDVLITKQERAEFEQLIEHHPGNDPRDALIVVLLTAMSKGEAYIIKLRERKQEALDTEFDKIAFQALGLEAITKELEAKWIKKHARLKTAIDTVLDTYLQGESK